MLRWALSFLLLAVIAAFLGFGGLADTSAGIAKLLFYLFFVVFLLTFVVGLVSGKRAT
jgi:uncharacterized membrane protein YtjA (UPF0391 family)